MTENIQRIIYLARLQNEVERSSHKTLSRKSGFISVPVCRAFKLRTFAPPLHSMYAAKDRTLFKFPLASPSFKHHW